MRYRAGDQVWVGDDRRRRYRLRIGHMDSRELRGTILEEVLGPPGPRRRLVVAQALLKGERMDWTIQKATELGIDRFVPLVTSNTVVRPRAGRIDAQQERWQRIALQAAQQAERWEVPTVDPPQEVRQFLQTSASTADRLVLVEPRDCLKNQGSLSSVSLGDCERDQIMLVIGPEGGWTQEELEVAVSCGYRTVTLGQRVLRAETATLAALAVVQSRLGNLG